MSMLERKMPWMSQFPGRSRKRKSGGRTSENKRQLEDALAKAKEEDEAYGWSCTVYHPNVVPFYESLHGYSLFDGDHRRLLSRVSASSKRYPGKILMNLILFYKQDKRKAVLHSIC
jgi:hypothetical protein